MRSVYLITALSGLWHRGVDAVHIASQKWNWPVQPTAIPVATSLDQWAPGPAPTAGPDLGMVEIELARREVLGQTCGYISGDRASSFGCPIGSQCVNNGRASAMFCCDSHIAVTATGCVAITACLDSATFATITTIISAPTGWCSNAQYPYCVPYVYGDAPVSGFTWFQCEHSYTRRVVYGQTTDEPTTEPTTTTTPSHTTSPTPTTTTISSSSTPASGDSSTPVGPIVGGVVGGVAVIGLIVLGVFFLLRKKRVPEATAPPPVQQQPDVQQWQQAQQPWPASPGSGPPGYTGDYNRASMVKSPFERDSVLGSPSSGGMPSPSPGFQQGGFPPVPQYGAASPPPQQPMGQTSPVGYQPPVHHHELPTAAGDRELRELQG